MDKVGLGFGIFISLLLIAYTILFIAFVIEFFDVNFIPFYIVTFILIGLIFVMACILLYDTITEG